VTWHTEAELDRLDSALMDLPEDNDPMILTEFDGFCAGLITCPEMIAPSVWLSEVWGPGGAPELKDLSEMQVMLDLIMTHYNRVASLLMMQGEYYPVMDEDRRNGDILWEFWMMGFAAAMRAARGLGRHRSQRQRPGDKGVQADGGACRHRGSVLGRKAPRGR